MDFSGCHDDDSFGPAVRGCRGDFDFTIRFEQLVLGIIPPAVFVPLVFPRLLHLWQRPNIVGGPILLAAKLVAIIALAGLQLGLLILSASQPGKFKALLSASSALGLLSSICIFILSHAEHTRSPRPSILLSSYLVLSVLFDITLARTFWMAREDSLAGAGSRVSLVVAGYDLNSAETVFCRLFSAALAFRVVLLLLESVQKKSIFRPDAGWKAEEHSPEETSGLFGLGAYAWLNTIFLKGYNTVLTIDDLFALDYSMSTQRLEAKLAKYANDLPPPKEGDVPDAPRSLYNFGRKKHGLTRALVKALATEFLLPIGPRLALSGFLFGQPFLINAALTYLELPADVAPRDHGYGLIGATFIIYLGVAVSTAVYFYYMERAMFMVRGALAGAVYRKTTEQRLDAADDAAALTLMSTDVERIRTGLLTINEYWANIIQVALASWLLERQLGAAFVAPLVVILCSIGAIGSLAVITGRRQKAWMALIQKRVGMTSNAIVHMKHLKISGLAAPVETLIQQLRLDELAMGSRFRIIICFAVTAAYSPQMLSPVFAFVFTARSLDTASVFTALSFVILVTMPFIMVLQGLPTVVSAFACLERVQEFLEKPPREDFRTPLTETRKTLEKPDTSEPGESDTVVIDAASLGWGNDKFSLPNVRLAIPSSKLTIVVGPVAAGKSTLCKALLSEVPHLSAGSSLRVDLRTHNGRLRRIGYCDQTPFLFNASVRDNVIGLAGTDAEFDEARYRQAIEAAMLLPDLALLPQGDRTRVGSNGITLSGGQKQRVSIARALYVDTDLYIFDDVLSGLDADTEEHVFNRVFGADGILTKQRNATAILCTHSVRHLPAAEYVVALDAKGAIVEQGSFETLLANRNYVASLGVKDKKKKKGGAGGSVVRESREGGESSDLDSAQASTDGPMAAAMAGRDGGRDEPAGTDLTAAQMAGRALGDRSVYKHYFVRIGPWPLIAFAIFGLSFGFLYNWGNIWLKFWVEDRVRIPHANHSTGFYLGMYGFFQALGLACLFIVSLVNFRTVIQISGARLHLEALQTVVRAPLRFFTKTDNGIITNYFSQDMTLIDGELPSSLTNVGVGWFLTLCTAAVIATSSPYLAICYPFIGGIFFGIQKFYLRTSRQLRLLDLEAKSPLYSHFLDTMKGLATFRAFGWVAPGVALNDRLVDRSQRPAYLLAMIQRWLTFSIQSVMVILSTTVVTLATQLRSNTAFTGASMILLMNFGDVLSFIMYAYTMLETSLGAISRLKTFSENVHGESYDDNADENVKPPLAWPTRGAIRLNNVSATYDDTSSDSSDLRKPPQMVLDNISLTLRAGAKVAICGRTGSGKSSFILLLLRLLDPYAPGDGGVPEKDVSASDQDTSLAADGVFIDGLPLHTIDRPTLRERVIAVPQDAVFLPDGTSFRQNLDPFGAADASMCQAALETVELWPFVQERGGLEAGLAADTLSQGQKQLFSLGRAILRRRVRAAAGLSGPGSGILLLDEVSSSVDQKTDRAMQTVIRDEFAGYTVIMVSHRLDMVLATCDTVVVLDQGRVVETGVPSELVESEGTRFRELWLVGKKA
ncbi:ABC transporter [Sporothrix schenckii 1099-18]|uniref:ABC transporter n=1 Tax=Sporothrix schenckii 1099-18 TaxID=1397361 RepID=A0A0F2M9J1_SPOSC|nr:ABC transporter [Sporothrix schenckii 1099-18]KJR86312.1 ABC transporter [Sporothrix schenckii 1099-18]